MKLSVELNFLTSVPVFETHKRGKNWCAIIQRDPTAPAGLARKFCEIGKGEFYYKVEFKVGDTLEFGADYYTGGGSKAPKRFYCVVVAVSEEEVEVIEYPTAIQALKAAKEETTYLYPA